MFRIRRIYDDTLEIDRQALLQVQSILRGQFSALSPREVEKVVRQLRDPLRYRFRFILFVVEDMHHTVRGFALLSHDPQQRFCFLDYISAAPGRTAGGIGSTLYERVREEAKKLDAIGIFFECLPDCRQLCPEEALLADNRSRLRFYERYGARPIVNTAYETPLKPTDACPPFLVFDGLGRGDGLSRDEARTVVRSILERKYGRRCPAGYIDMVVDSIKDDPVRLRPPLYLKKKPPATAVNAVPSLEKRIALFVNDRHSIHHVHDRGYVESPVRVSHILEGLEKSGLFDRLPARHHGGAILEEIHDRDYLNYFKRMCELLPAGKSVYPYVFPIRNAARPPKEMAVRAGYYCIDTFTPLNRNAYLAAKGAVDCALSACDSVLGGYRSAYALVRPPGHHAERRAFGGFCYFNSSAAAAQYLSRRGPVAVLDIDYHHGNGTQNIFYERGDVLTLSIHGHPSFAYPYFSGFAEETGAGPGSGCNRNYPLPEEVGGAAYRETLARALAAVRRFRPKFLVVALGLDPARKDPTGTWQLEPDDFFENGRMIGSCCLPTVVVQEGGYRLRGLGINARRFFEGLAAGNRQCGPGRPGGK
ncbi:MAG: acetylpolyamine amidohydrolase [Thermodesulfobacteriota bacterium]